MDVQFPVTIFGMSSHSLFEFLAFFIGFQTYRRMRNEKELAEPKLVWILVGAIVGGISGSFLLYWFEDPVATFTQLQPVSYYVDGKSIVGGLLGGLIGVELAKKKIGHTRSTGDDMAIPLIIGLIIGRIGCFLTGLDDHTYGIATSLPWGIDFGDGVKRHPTQLYEQVYLVFLLFVLLIQKRNEWGWNGLRFQLFMTGYLTFRIVIEEWKPIADPYIGLNNIQVASIIGLLYYGQLMIRKGIDHYQTKGESTYA
ncbi:MAG: prolipoprotein diacylglyceryl transferase family protein [Bacillaceae bacterium]